MYDPKTCTSQERALRERAESETREILSKYDRLNVFPRRFEQDLVQILYKDYCPRIPGTCQGSLLLTNVSRNMNLCYGFKEVCVLKTSLGEHFKHLASLAIEKYNEQGKGQWVVEELIYLSVRSNYFGKFEYILCFGARNISSKDLEAFDAYIDQRRADSESYVVKRVDPLRKVDEIGSPEDKGEQLDDSIVRF